MSEAERRVAVFFYGSYMNPGVLGEVAIVPPRLEPATLSGFDIVIRPRANLVRSPSAIVHGVASDLTHTELARLYRHAEDVLGEVYLPEAVLVETRGRRFEPALTYVCHSMKPRPAAADYVERILVAARVAGLPADYIDRLAAFSP